MSQTPENSPSLAEMEVPDGEDPIDLEAPEDGTGSCSEADPEGDEDEVLEGVIEDE